MDTTTPPEGQLSIDQCWVMLDTETVGRIALIVDGHPEIFPVNFVLERRAIVFRTAGGTKLWAAMTAKPVAFEIDGYDAHEQMAWSVVARGESELIESPEEKNAVDASSLSRGSRETRTTTFGWPRRH
ncbi:FMN binding protein [Arthrobacter sp. Hiyo6]|nr:FMN binding protein [Arthrobacter sp. Hiyo6]